MVADNIITDNFPHDCPHETNIERRQKISGSHVTTISIKRTKRNYLSCCVHYVVSLCSFYENLLGIPLFASLQKPSLLNGIPLAYLKIYYYFKNNIVQSITCLVCVAKRLKLKILLPKSNWQKKNNINNTIITYLFSPVLCFVFCILLHSPFAWSLCTHFLAKK